MENKYVLTEKELLSLLVDSQKYNALECGGVDNWSGYGESLYGYLNDDLDDEDYDDDFEEDDNEDTRKDWNDIAKEMLINYEKI